MYADNLLQKKAMNVPARQAITATMKIFKKVAIIICK